MKRTFYFFAALVLVCSLAGCETVKGVGRDITGASSSVQEAMSRRK
jgi:predicted small secreted protein